MTKRSRPRPATNPRRSPLLLHRLNFGGLTLSLVFFNLSLTPSLLPRSWLFQGILSGLTAVIGYGLGTLAASSIRLGLRGREPRAPVKKLAWTLLAAAGSLMTLYFFTTADNWQRDVRRLMGMKEQYPYHAFSTLLMSLAVAAFLLLLARLVRLFGRGLNTLLDRFISKQLANAIGFGLTAIITIWFARSIVVHSFMGYVNNLSSVANDRTAAGVQQPTSPYVTGGPESLVPWESLGKQGRNFTGKAPPTTELEAFSGRLAQPPIRVYAGTKSAATLQGEADLVLKELERTGAFDRQILVVITSTGTGWVDQNVAESLEYMYNGDTALASMQYSYLPSWVSFLSDKSQATLASETLIRTVRHKLNTLPKEHRPKFYVFGESLGSYGTETAFGTLDNLQRNVDGALFVGPPFANPLWHNLVARRDPGTPVWLPQFNYGKEVRFAREPDDFYRQPADTWQAPRIAYIQQSSDPINWWNPSLLFQKPEWLAGRRGPDVSKYVHYTPIVTFWQVSVDLALAGKVPAGHGHVYGAKVADGWAAVAAPPGWTNEDTARLHTIIEVHSKLP